MNAPWMSLEVLGTRQQGEARHALPDPPARLFVADRGFGRPGRRVWHFFAGPDSLLVSKWSLVNGEECPDGLIWVRKFKSVEMA